MSSIPPEARGLVVPAAILWAVSIAFSGFVFWRYMELHDAVLRLEIRDADQERIVRDVNERLLRLDERERMLEQKR